MSLKRLFAMSALGSAALACGDTASPNASPQVPAVVPTADAALDATTPGLTDAGPKGECDSFNPLKNVYFGDLHLHTSYSLDAMAVGTKAPPEQAYLFAKKKATVNIGEGVAGTPPNVIEIGRKLDFLAITDHSEFFDLIELCTIDTKSPYYADPYCRALRNQGSQAQLAAVAAAGLRLTSNDPRNFAICAGAANSAACDTASQTVWGREQQAAKLANDKCNFTTFNAYEWTGTTGTANLHRNVIFGTDAVPAAPLDYIRYPSAHDLWTGLAKQCTGNCDLLTIPHNSNLSYGAMFNINTEDIPYMQKYQTLVEIFQHKGASECLNAPIMPPGTLVDPECNFEHATVSIAALILGTVGGGNANLTPDERTNLEYPSYVRSAMERGLTYYASSKVNPLQMGFVAATDSHNASPGYVEEASWKGHLGATDDSPEERLSAQNSSFNPAGITAVWAEENTRASIFSAFKRREVYATSGPRMAVRFYEVPDGSPDPCEDSAFPAKAVGAGAVPMGGSFNTGAGPRFVVYAMKDQTDLSEVHIIKAASDVAGNVKEIIQKIPLTSAQAAAACVTWKDPAFEAGKPAFYYARVFEKEVPRWSSYDCQKVDPTAFPLCAETDPTKGGLNIKIRERAWTSPIWYLP